SSGARELANALDAAGEAKEQAAKAQERFAKAGGEETADENQSVVEALNNLEAELTKDPQNTEAIVEATKALKEEVAELEKASVARELANAITGAEKAKEQALASQEQYISSGGSQSSQGYQKVEAEKQKLEAAILANPKQVELIKVTTESLNELTKTLDKEASKLMREYFVNEISKLQDVQGMRDINEEIEQANMNLGDKGAVYRQFVDKVLTEDSIVFAGAGDVQIVKEAIGRSDKETEAKQEKYVALAEKAVGEVSVADAPTKTAKFQKEANIETARVIDQVSNKNEKDRLTNLQELYVDTLSLTRDNAFTFKDGDTWESVTSNFIVLAKGAYGTSISWESSKENVVNITEDLAKTTRQAKDQSVILTADVTRANQQLEKTFLLIIKRNNVGAKKMETTYRQANVETGSVSNNPEAIQRINLYGLNSNTIQNRIDKLIITDAILPNATSDKVTFYLPDDSNSIADELAVEVPLQTLEKINGDMNVKTDQATLILGSDMIKAMQQAGIDLFFHIVPIRNQEERQEVVNRVNDSELIRSAVQDVLGEEAIANVLGTPKEIETNYAGYRTEVILPLDDVLYEGIDLSMLRVFIEHSDGDLEVVEGELIYEDGLVTGLKFVIDKFSTFTIFEIAKEDKAPENEEPPVVEGPAVPVESPEKPEVTPTVPVENSKGEESDLKEEQDDSAEEVMDENEVVEKTTDNSQKMPETATNMYNHLLLGTLTIIASIMLFIIANRRKKHN
ncbi:hypothetical protein NC661_06275, partial [Aquibacillus koreensis]